MFVNTRVLKAPLTGVNRYLREVLAAWPGSPPGQLAPPAFARQGPAAHAWEQLVLPRRAAGQLLWSPVHSGPVRLARQVVTVHDVVALDHPEWLHPRFARFYRWMLPRLVHRACHVIAISRFTRDRLIERTGLDANRVSVIALGVEARFAPAGPDAEARMRTALGLGERPYLLSLGSLEPRKNLPRLLEAWQRAQRRLPGDLQLVVAGEVGRAAVFGAAAPPAWPERTRALGRVDDAWLPALYSAARAFVYPSYYEGFGLPPLEAMACGTPALVGDTAAAREVLGEAALRVDPIDSGAIAQALVRLAKDPELRARHIELGRTRAAGYRWADTASATARLLAGYA